ncbi:MAG: YkgJ family cysteine cluster protein [bacterium]|nr:YkgJ family cysteine cluster protein [bacterium]
MNNDLLKKYSEVTDLIQTEFVRNTDKYGSKIKCREGCSLCCHQLFRITELDAFIIKDHVNNISIEERNILKEKATEYIKLFDLNDKIKPPCPALSDEGSCTIYEGRPVICRRFGPPVYDYKNPGKIFSCELNFSKGEEIDDIELIPNQTFIGKKWDELKTEFNIVTDAKENASTTIAEALLNS